MPGLVCRRRAISSVTLWPGSWPPSPGFEPCAILIWSSSANAAYSGVTPKRPDAICLIRELRSSRKRARILAALTAVRAGAEAVERDRHRLVRLGRERAVRHAAAGEAPEDLLDGLHLVEWHRRAGGNELEQVARLERAAAVDEGGEALVLLQAARPLTARRKEWAADTAWSASTTSGVVACGSPPGRNFT